MSPRSSPSSFLARLCVSRAVSSLGQSLLSGGRVRTCRLRGAMAAARRAALLCVALLTVAGAQQACPRADQAFELWTGFVFSAPGDLLDTRPGTLLLDECVRMCAQNSTCRGLNYETGLCVLFSTNAEQYAGKAAEMWGLFSHPQLREEKVDPDAKANN